MSLLTLPIEIRIQIYRLLFTPSKTLLLSDARSDTSTHSILPSTAKLQHHVSRSSQLLSTCRTILFEARPILYAATIFHVIVAQAFAGRLPCTLTDGHFAAPYVQHLIWQLDCDMMKHFYPEDLRLDPSTFAEVETLELRIRADTWRNSFLGEWCDREAFVKGREQAVLYAKTLGEIMVKGRNGEVNLVEDRSQLGRGRVVLRLVRGTVKSRSEQELLLT